MFLTHVPMEIPVFLTGGTLVSLCNIDLKRLILQVFRVNYEQGSCQVWETSHGWR